MLAQWVRKMLSDESRFSVDHHDGRIRVWWRLGERYTTTSIALHARWRGGSVMVWAGIWSTGKTELVVINGNLNWQRYVK